MSSKKRSLIGFALVSALLLGVACGAASQDASKKKSGGKEGAAGGGVAARVGDRTITLAEVDEKAMTANINAYQALYDARRAALDQIISDLLLEREAAEKGVTKEKLLEEALNTESLAVTDAEVESFFNENQGMMGGRTLDQLRGQIHQYLANQKVGEARQAFFDVLKKKAGVKIALDPPRAPVQIAANDPVKGPADARITIVEFSDFQ